MADGSLVDERFSALMNRFGSPDPTPGGGSAAAAAGALGVSLGLMVCALTVGRKKYAEAEEDVAAIQARLRERKEQLCGLVDEDAAAYREVMKARALPRGTDEEKTGRKAALGTALRQAAYVPVRTISELLLALEDTDRLLRIGNINARTDAGTAIALLNAAIMGAYLNVRVNLTSINDEAFTKKARELVDQALMNSSEKVRESFLWLNERF